MSRVSQIWVAVITTLLFVTVVFVFFPDLIYARNINSYKDTISDSFPEAQSNHKLSFVLNTTVSPGGIFEVTPPVGFTTLASSSFSAERNVELYVNGSARTGGITQTADDDLIEIIPGSPGLIRYTLNTTTGINTGSNLELRIGNHTSKSLIDSVEYSSTTGTTTTIGDIKPIINATTKGTHKVKLRVYDGVPVADADFHISLIDRVGIGPVDTTEIIPPLRFNGAPTSTVTGVTQNVEIFVETDELATCRYSETPGVDFFSMTSIFTNTGKIYHTQIIAVTADTVESFYVRCMDDEGNFNTDDYLIQFTVSAVPTGTSNTEGDIDGDGTGTGNQGTGSGGGGGGDSGASDGVSPSEGGTTGGGGSGGGGGGGSGESSGGSAGGGFESTSAPYRSGDGRVMVTGYAFPRSEIVVLADGKEAERSRAGVDGAYEITLDGIARGVYTFGVYAIDASQIKSSTFSTSFTVAGARTSTLSNINLSPSIKVTPDPVPVGTTALVTGYTQPNATITLENKKEGSSASLKTFTTTADGAGKWQISIETANFSAGTYQVRAKSEQAGGVTTNFSNFTLYGVGQDAKRPINADLNGDSKVNLVDFSILLFWWNTDGGNSEPSADINSDEKVNLVDFSILLFNWTG